MASHYVDPSAIWALFMDIFEGNEYACAGAMGNMQAESGLYSDQAENLWNQMTGHSDEWLTDGINDGTITLADFLQRNWYVNDYGFGYGLSQWTTASRRTKLWEFTIGAGEPIDNYHCQFDYIIWEWCSTESYYNQYLAGMKACTTVEQATRYYCTNYEGGAWNQQRLTYAENWYRTFAIGGQYHISITTSGNGTAYATPPNADAGDTIIFKATPASGESLVDIIATLVTTGASMAIAVTTNVQTFVMPADNLSIYVEFTGTPPTPPTPTPAYKKHHMPIWMYPSLRRLT